MIRSSFLNVYSYIGIEKSEHYACISHLFHHCQNNLENGSAPVDAVHHDQAGMVELTAAAACSQSSCITENRIPTGSRNRHILQGLPLVTQFCQLGSPTQWLHPLSSQVTSSGPSVLTYMETEHFGLKP